jgi:hypothetical protein
MSIEERIIIAADSGCIHVCTALTLGCANQLKRCCCVHLFICAAAAPTPAPAVVVEPPPGPGPPPPAGPRPPVTVPTPEESFCGLNYWDEGRSPQQFFANTGRVLFNWHLEPQYPTVLDAYGESQPGDDFDFGNFFNGGLGSYDPNDTTQQWRYYEGQLYIDNYGCLHGASELNLDIRECTSDTASAQLWNIVVVCNSGSTAPEQRITHFSTTELYIIYQIRSVTAPNMCLQYLADGAYNYFGVGPCVAENSWWYSPGLAGV